MGAFLLFLFFVFINENIAIPQNELTFPPSVASELSPADLYNLPIRRYKDEYYDPFLQDIYSESNQQTKQFLEDSIYNPYKDYDTTGLDRLYSEVPLQSNIYNDYMTIQRNPEFLSDSKCQSRRNYNDFLLQDYPYKETQNAEAWRSDREEILKRAKEYDPQDFSRDTGKVQSNSNIFYTNNKYISDIYGSADKPNEKIITNPEFDERSKLQDNLQITLNSENCLDNACPPNNSPIDESKGVIKKNSEFSERSYHVNVYNRHANQKPCKNYLGKQRTPNEADEKIDKTHLKHSLTSSASALENRLLTSHIKKTFEKVKGDEDISQIQRNYPPLWKSQPNEKYMNGFENKFRNLYGENNFKDFQKITKQPKTATPFFTLPQHIASQQNNRTNHFESHNTFEIPLKESQNKLTEIHSESANQLCQETSHITGCNERKMEEIPFNLSKEHMQTTAPRNILSHYDLTTINRKQIEELQKPQQHYEKLNVFPSFDVNYKRINDCVQPLNVNHVDNYEQRNHDTFLNLQVSDKASLNGFNNREYSMDQIKASYNPSNMKSLICNEHMKNDNEFYKKTNSETIFIEPDFAKDTVIVKSEINNIIPERTNTIINQVPRSYAGRNNLTSNNKDGDILLQNNISTGLYRTLELNPSFYEANPHSTQKMEQNNTTKFYSHPPGADLPQSTNINHDFQDKGRNYYSGINVLSSTPVKPEQSTQIMSTPLYTIQAPNNSYYEINRPKVTVLNPTSMVQKNPQGHQNPTIQYIPSYRYQHIGPTVDAPKVHILSPNYTKLNPLKPTISNPKGLANTGSQILSSVNQLSTSLNNIASIIVCNMLSSLNKDISKTLKAPLPQNSNVSNLLTSSEIPSFEVTHPCIESPRYLPDTLIKSPKQDTASTPSNKSSKPCVSTITINVLPPAQQSTNDIIILV